MEIIGILFFVLPIILGFIPARIVYWKLNKNDSKWKLHISILAFIFFTFLLWAIIGAILLSQIQFSR